MSELRLFRRLFIAVAGLALATVGLASGAFLARVIWVYRREIA